MSEYKESTGEKPNEVGYVSVKRVPNIIVETISTNEKAVFMESMEKKEYTTMVPVPDGHVRAIVLMDYEGMEDKLYPGDVVDMPERRFKSLCNRGFVAIYNGTRIPNKDR